MFWLIVKGAVLEIQCSFDPASEVSSSSLRLQRESHIHSGIGSTSDSYRPALEKAGLMRSVH